MKSSPGRKRTRKELRALAGDVSTTELDEPCQEAMATLMGIVRRRRGSLNARVLRDYARALLDTESKPSRRVRTFTDLLGGNQMFVNLLLPWLGVDDILALCNADLHLGQFLIVPDSTSIWSATALPMAKYWAGRIMQFAPWIGTTMQELERDGLLFLPVDLVDRVTRRDDSVGTWLAWTRDVSPPIRGVVQASPVHVKSRPPIVTTGFHWYWLAVQLHSNGPWTWSKKDSPMPSTWYSPFDGKYSLGFANARKDCRRIGVQHSTMAWLWKHRRFLWGFSEATSAYYDRLQVGAYCRALQLFLSSCPVTIRADWEPYSEGIGVFSVGNFWDLLGAMRGRQSNHMFVYEPEDLMAKGSYVPIDPGRCEQLGIPDWGQVNAFNAARYSPYHGARHVIPPCAMDWYQDMHSARKNISPMCAPCVKRYHRLLMYRCQLDNIRVPPCFAGAIEH